MLEMTDLRHAENPRLSIRFELDSFGIMTAIAGSIGNAIERTAACEFSAPDILTYLPAGVGVRTEASRLILQTSLDHEFAAALAALCARATLTRDLAATIESLPGTPHARLAPIADAIRRLASLCFVVRNTCDRSDGESAPPGGQQARRRIDQLLRVVSAGGTPCLDHCGRLSVPGWAERRTTHRQSARAEVVIVHSGLQRVGSVENISQAGMGIAGVAGLAIGVGVEVLFEGGVIRKAHVIWASGDRAGLAFDSQLDATLLGAVMVAHGALPS